MTYRETYAPHLLPKVRSQILLDTIAGYPCTLRVASLVPGHACAPRSTVVPCHIDGGGKGMATKETDPLVVAGCLHCHDIVDMRGHHWKYLMERSPAAVLHRCICAIRETQAMLMMDGIITIKGAVEIKGTPFLREIR